jgi:hypothetical protein
MLMLADGERVALWQGPWRWVEARIRYAAMGDIGLTDL